MQQTTDTVLMIEPVDFAFNPQTAKNNYFQTDDESALTQDKALLEFKNYVQTLRDHGVRVITVKDTEVPHTPDSVFPNNWISFSQTGKVYLYPMYAPNRRDERRFDVIEIIKQAGYEINEIVDLSFHEKEDIFLEGTGSMIFDHTAAKAYGSISQRLDESLFKSFCERIEYEPVVFHSYQDTPMGRMPIYHTNVMMCIGDHFAVICLDAIDDTDERKMVAESLMSSGKEIIEITEEQVTKFAGNMLQVSGTDGQTILVMSTTAYHALTDAQIARIESYTKIVHTDIATIETNGGGSARCMLAEVFCPRV